MCIFKGIIRYRLKNTIINALLASLVQKFCKKKPHLQRGTTPHHLKVAMYTKALPKGHNSTKC